LKPLLVEHWGEWDPEQLEISVIIVTTWTAQLMHETLDALAQQTNHQFVVYIIDNTPGLGDWNQINDYMPQYNNIYPYVLLKSKFNLGYAGGNNYGLRRAKTPYLFLLNPDTDLDTDAIEKIVGYMKDHLEIGMLCPKVLFNAPRDRFWYAGAVINPRNPYYAYHIGQYQKDRGQYNLIKETAYGCGCSLITTKEAIQKIGLLDELFFVYSEETDWNLRAHQAGFKIIYYPETTIYHKVEYKPIHTGPVTRKSPFQVYLYIRNNIILVLKNYSIKDFIAFFCLHIVKKLGIELIRAIRQRNVKFFIAYWRATIMGIYLGIKRRTHHQCKKDIVRETKYILSFDSRTNSAFQFRKKLK
jgi:hypothetical protein